MHPTLASTRRAGGQARRGQYRATEIELVYCLSSHRAAGAVLITFSFVGTHIGLRSAKVARHARFVMKYEPPTLAAINNSSTPTTSPKIFDGLVTYDDNLSHSAACHVLGGVSGWAGIQLQTAPGRHVHDASLYIGGRGILILRSSRPSRGRGTFAMRDGRYPDDHTAVIGLLSVALPARRARTVGIADRSTPSL
jgi:hypothetical protein